MNRTFWKVTRYARAVRFWIPLGLAVLAFFGFGEARAQTCGVSGLSPPSYAPQLGAGQTEDKGKAYQRCITGLSGGRVNIGGLPREQNGCVLPDGPSGTYWRRRHTISACSSSSPGTVTHDGPEYHFTACPSDRPWSESLKKCTCPNGAIEQPDGSCKSCLDLNGEPGSPSGQSEVVRGFKSRCIGGCTLAMTSGWCTTVHGSGGGMMCSGQYQYTGASCSADPAPPLGPEDPGEPEPPTEPNQGCTPAGAGQTFCSKPNGEQCYTASTGKQICWTPGETGDKGDGPILQTRGPGETPKPPSSPTTTSGDTLTQTGSGTTTTITNITTNRTTITTTTNYTTGHATDSKPGEDEGEPDDGTGVPDGGDDDGTSATGGGNCDTPPIVSGDAALNMVANQTWATRCAVEAGNAANVSGDVGDCNSPFTVEGTNANAVKLRAMRAQICGERGERQGDSEVLDSLGEALEPGEGDSVFAELGSETISTTRFGGGGGACPAQAWSLGPIGTIDTTYLCAALAAIRLLFLAVATIWALRIIGGE